MKAVAILICVSWPGCRRAAGRHRPGTAAELGAGGRIHARDVQRSLNRGGMTRAGPEIQTGGGRIGGPEGVTDWQWRVLAITLARRLCSFSFFSLFLVDAPAQVL
ncbi:hypothetical protein FA95DRAFT_534683 [Auriscalpium vulgare]|uniref:Uncharacterized protein n=1 Tax=Auriscalpium vulgare TaxID=40419 RepID=A0ACB8RFT1_9AGAM|nr:hypothetical protein FA95DRAFT_534683 [Auriscalpium vulgare]